MLTRGAIAGLLVLLSLPGVALGQQRTISVTGDASLPAAYDTARASFGG